MSAFSSSPLRAEFQAGKFRPGQAEAVKKLSVILSEAKNDRA
jgi:hypothetical protein